VVTVPRTAVTHSLSGDSIYVARPAAESGDANAVGATGAGEAGVDLLAERRFVRTGQVREDRIAITFGLAAGEQVVTTGQLKLNPGAAIRIDKSQALSPPSERPKL